MRLILLNHSRHFSTLDNLPDDLVAFYCFEDFSVGPLSDWPSPANFAKQRADFWKTTSQFDLPDGIQMDYFVWHQVLPHIDVSQFATTPERDWPAFHEFETSAPMAVDVEIWSGNGARQHLWFWYAVAELARLGIDMERVSHCKIDDDVLYEINPKNWSKMLRGDPDRLFPAKPIATAKCLKLWDAVVRFPTTVDANLLGDDATNQVFEVLKGRHPDPVTGLTVPQCALLRNTPNDWTKMARIVGNAMVERYETGDDIGDMWLQSELKALALCDPPLVEIKGEGPMRNCEVRLTQAGAEKCQTLPPFVSTRAKKVKRRSAIHKPTPPPK